MGHVSEKGWDDIQRLASQHASEVVDVLLRAEESYQRVLELVKFHNNDNVAVAKQLFGTDTPSPGQLAKLNDAKNVLVAAHELYQALTDAQENRVSDMRKLI